MARFDMVFEGGGAKGSVFVGALQVLFAEGHTARRLIGTSAGAITASLLAAGYTPEEMLHAVNEKLPNGKPRFTTFMDKPKAADFSDDLRKSSQTAMALDSIPLPPLMDRRLLDLLLANPLYCQMFSFVEAGGLFTGGAFRAWLEEKMAVKGIAPSDTLKTFAAKTGKDLSVVASDTTDVEMLVLNHRTAPDVPVTWAVRMSMSIPFVWREVVWQKEWGLYRGREKTGKAIVDGGVLSNFPIRLIAEPSPAIMGDEDPFAAGNLGLLIDEGLDVPQREKATAAAAAPTTPSPEHRHKPPSINDFKTVRRVTRLIDTMMGARDNQDIRDHAAEICRLPAKNYGTTEFDMSPERLEALIEGGRQAMREHLRVRIPAARA
jgi:NTE family protein